MTEITCKVDDCNDPPRGPHGLCNKHRLRLQRHGALTPKSYERGFQHKWVHELLAELRKSGDPGHCIEWPFKINVNGYGVLELDRPNQAHRVVLAMWQDVEPPKGMDCCHARLPVCRNRACVNPFHLRWDTRKNNMADAKADREFLAKGGGANANP